MSLTDMLVACEEFKMRGNTYFREGIYTMAADRYRKVLVYLEYAFPKTEPDELATDQMRLTCLVNSALCMLRMKQYGEAVQNCYEALLIDKCNIKALYRRAQAYRLDHDFEQVEFCHEAKQSVIVFGILSPFRHSWTLTEP